LASIRGILRNSEGEIQYIYNRALGEGTNNEMEFTAMEQGLRILGKLQASAAVVEGDSQLIITVARRMYAGAKASKVTQHWRLAKVTETIVEHLGHLKGLIFQAVRRKANMVAGHLENYGIENPTSIMDRCWQDVTYPEIRNKCTLLSSQDMMNER